MSLAPALSPPAVAESYLNAHAGLWSWLSTRDHKRIGIMFLVTTTFFLFVGGLFALLLRIELLTPGKTLFEAMTYDRLFTLHGVTMVFFFMIPAIPGAFGNFMLPLMLGAHDVAFPRLNLLSYYLYLLGASLGVWGMIHGGADTGWTFYTPYSTTTITRVVPVLLGVFISGFSNILTGLNFIVTTHTMRAKGMGWLRVPLFVWGLYGTAVIQVLATPVLGMTLALVAIEHFLGTGIFDPTRGGDPLLFEHLFWFYSHPAVYIMVLPAFGVISEIVPTFAHRPIFGYKAIAFSSFGIAFLGFLTWGHHLFVAGQSAIDAGIFGFLSMLVGVFTAVKVFNWVGTLYKGSIEFKTPFSYLVGFLFFIVFGGMTGIALATVGLDVPWHDTYFVVAHFHFVMAGSVVMAFLAALHYWFPKMFGKMYPEGWGLVASTFVVFGFLFTFIPQFLLGNAGMPRRYYSYAPRFQWLHVASTIGSWILGIGLLIILTYVILTLLFAPRCEENPWGAPGYEWETPSPPPEHNFAVTPVITRGPYDFPGTEPSHAA